MPSVDPSPGRIDEDPGSCPCLLDARRLVEDESEPVSDPLLPVERSLSLPRLFHDS